MGKERRVYFDKRSYSTTRVITQTYSSSDNCISQDKPVKRLLSKNTLFPSTSGAVKLNDSTTLQPHCCVAMVPTLRERDLILQQALQTAQKC